MPADRIWTLGYRFVENIAQHRRIRARALGVASSVTDQRLEFDVNGRPYPRHADIIGWPRGDEPKDAQMMVAHEIANKLTLEIDPRGG